ncbi:MAG: Stk1 family PASTA domain-containing Ser/Thr kinase [Lachnospiraceae bacterium]|nr:Stk1 family PASTA domain-containing Ser/Thr kinase [Candidatus Minthocola equi]
MVLETGTVLSERYEISNPIGSGGMSDVYKALDYKLGRSVAVKVLKEEFAQDQSFVEKFRMEAQSAACLSNPNIVNIYDVGEDGNVYYIIMELIDGITLKKYIDRRKRLGVREAIEVAMQVAYGLEAAHGEHIIHRDIEPQNIMITREGKIKVTDFGIARAASTQSISANEMGSVHYISPEQAKGSFTDERSDIYSLGITMYEMLTGRVPFEGDSSVSVALQHINAEMTPPTVYEPLIPISLEKIILKCTQKNPVARYASASELIDDLKKALTSPNEDFVKIITPVEVPDVNRQDSDAGLKYELEKDAEARYQLGDDADNDDSSTGTELDELIELEANEAKFEKLVTYIGIGVGAAIVILFIIIGIASCGGYGGSTDPDATSEAPTSEEATTAAPYVNMISLNGMTYEQAEAALNSLGLYMRATYEQHEGGVVGQIFDQDIPAGTSIAPGNIINVIICTDQNGLMIPYAVEGVDPSVVINILKQAGFTNISTDFAEEHSKNIPAGRVIRIDPASGSTAPADARIKLVVSLGPNITYLNMPELLRMTEEQAITTIESFNLTVGSITHEMSDEDPEGTVIGQKPSAGESVPEGTTVDIVISTGVRDKQRMPSLLNMTLDEATSTLREFGLRVGRVSNDLNESAPDGVVLSQSIDVGAPITPNMSVDLTINRLPSGPTEPTSPTSPTEPTSATEPSSDPEPVTEPEPSTSESPSEGG